MSHLRPLARRAPAGPLGFSCTVTQGAHLSFVRLAGEMGTASAPTLSRALTGALEHRPLLVLVDMRDVGSLDVHAAQVLIQARAALAADEVRLVVFRDGTASGPWWAPLEADGALELMSI